MTTQRTGIISYASYLPYFRLTRAEIANALGTNAFAGARAVASYDEDSTTMAVEAGRVALAATDVVPETVLFATTTPAYTDKTNATAIRAALALGHNGLAADMAGSVRCGIAALRAGLANPKPALVVTADVRTGRPSSPDERDGGDGAAALLVGPADESQLLAEYVGGASVSAEFLDRYRTPGAPYSVVWEERFGEHAYQPLVTQALADAFKDAGVAIGNVDKAIITGVHNRAVRAAARASGFSDDVLIDDLTSSIGNTGTAHLGILLAATLDRAKPGQLIAVLQLADGVDVALFRVCNALSQFTVKPNVADQLDHCRDDLRYATYLTWRGLLHREPPRRPDPERPAAPPSLRNDDWKFAFSGSRCTACGTRHLPPQRVCLQCDTVDAMTPEPLASAAGVIATLTTDWLAYTLNPPMVVGVIDFDGGGRFQCELTDVGDGDVNIGKRVRMTFRRLYTTSDGVHNYFWKARPERKGEQ